MESEISTNSIIDIYKHTDDKNNKHKGSITEPTKETFISCI